MLTEAVRRKEWWSYKLPPLLGFAYLGLAVGAMPLAESWDALVLTMFWMIGAAGFGYYCNDVFDIEQDILVGKTNSAAEHSPIIRFLMLVGLACMAVLPWVLMDKGTALIGLAVAHLILFLLYSAPPVRLKNRGWAGAAADTLYAHVLPSVMVLYAFGQHGSPQWSVLIVVAALWQAALGFRSILTHQITDLDSDVFNVTRTFAVDLGRAKAERLLALTLPSIEVFVIFVFVLSIVPLSAGIAFGAVITVALVFISKPFGEGVLKYHRQRNEVVSSIFNQIQEAYLPLIFLVSLCTVDSWYTLVAIIHLFLFLAGNAHVLNLGRDHVVKPLYYRGLIGFIYIGLLKRSYYHGARPFYFGIRWVATRIYYALVVWPAYNIGLRLLVQLWHLAYRVRHGRWHQSYRGNAPR